VCYIGMGDFGTKMQRKLNYSSYENPEIGTRLGERRQGAHGTPAGIERVGGSATYVPKKKRGRATATDMRRQKNRGVTVPCPLVASFLKPKGAEGIGRGERGLKKGRNILGRGMIPCQRLCAARKIPLARAGWGNPKNVT